MKHSRILQSYIGRLNRSDIEKIIEANNNCHYAGQQLGTNSQVKAHHELTKACNNAMDNMLNSDIEVLERIINDCV